MSDKIYSPKEAAIAVLKKAEEMLKAIPNSNMGKVQENNETPPDSVEHQKAPEQNPDEIKENNNPPAGALPQAGNEFEGCKGHIKLAKFIGHIESKRKSRNPNG